MTKRSRWAACVAAGLLAASLIAASAQAGEWTPRLIPGDDPPLTEGDPDTPPGGVGYEVHFFNNLTWVEFWSHFPIFRVQATPRQTLVSQPRVIEARSTKAGRK